MKICPNEVCDRMTKMLFCANYRKNFSKRITLQIGKANKSQFSPNLLWKASEKLLRPILLWLSYGSSSRLPKKTRYMLIYEDKHHDN